MKMAIQIKNENFLDDMFHKGQSHSTAVSKICKLERCSDHCNDGGILTFLAMKLLPFSWGNQSNLKVFWGRGFM